MKKDEKSRIKPGSNDIDENTLSIEADKSPDFDFFLSAQKEEKIIGRKKGKMKIDKSTLFFLSDYSMPDEDGG